MTSKQKTNNFTKLLNNFRTEYLMYDLALPGVPNNINRIKKICKQIVECDICEDDFKNTIYENSCLRES